MSHPDTIRIETCSRDYGLCWDVKVYLFQGPWHRPVLLQSARRVSGAALEAIRAHWRAYERAGCPRLAAAAE